MNQNNLERTLARITGESVRRIKNMGFTLIALPRQTLPAPGKRAINCFVPTRKAVR